MNIGNGWFFIGAVLHSWWLLRRAMLRRSLERSIFNYGSVAPNYDVMVCWLYWCGLVCLNLNWVLFALPSYYKLIIVKRCRFNILRYNAICIAGSCIISFFGYLAIVELEEDFHMLFHFLNFLRLFTDSGSLLSVDLPETSFFTIDMIPLLHAVNHIICCIMSRFVNWSPAIISLGLMKLLLLELIVVVVELTASTRTQFYRRTDLLRGRFMTLIYREFFWTLNLFTFESDHVRTFELCWGFQASFSSCIKKLKIWEILLSMSIWSHICSTVSRMSMRQVNFA